MIPVALPTYNRPNYLKQTLSWLESNKLADEILLVTSEEPNKECQELISNTTLKTERTINNKRLGLCANVCQAISKAAEKADWFVCVEDDVFIGYDALELAKSCLKDTSKEILTFENTDTGLGDDFAKVKIDTWFHCHGWACSSYVWQRFMNDFDPLKNPNQSWANPFNYWLQNKDVRKLIPEVSRSYYIGVDGQFSNPDKYKKHVPNHWIRMAQPARDYFIDYLSLRNSTPSKGYILNECKVFYERSRKV